MFTEKIKPIIYNGVTTIRGKDLIPKGIGTDRWSYTDDKEQLHKNKLNHLL